jgi:hypothetical protein
MAAQYYEHGLPTPKPAPPSGLNAPVGKKALLVVLGILVLIVISEVRK